MQNLFWFQLFILMFPYLLKFFFFLSPPFYALLGPTYFKQVNENRIILKR